MAATTPAISEPRSQLTCDGDSAATKSTSSVYTRKSQSDLGERHATTLASGGGLEVPMNVRDMRRHSASDVGKMCKMVSETIPEHEVATHSKECEDAVGKDTRKMSLSARKTSATGKVSLTICIVLLAFDIFMCNLSNPKTRVGMLPR